MWDGVLRRKLGMGRTGGHGRGVLGCQVGQACNGEVRGRPSSRRGLPVDEVELGIAYVVAGGNCVGPRVVETVACLLRKSSFGRCTS